MGLWSNLKGITGLGSSAGFLKSSSTGELSVDTTDYLDLTNTASISTAGIVQLTNTYSGSSEVLAVTQKGVSDGLSSLKYFVAGIITLPTIEDNEDGSVTIGTNGNASFYTSADGNSSLVNLDLSTGATLTMTDGAINYIYSNYNGGSPIYATTLTPATFLADYRLCACFRVVREGITLYITNYDAYGVALADKQLFKDVSVNSFQRQSGLAISTTGTRISTISSGVVWLGVQPYSLEENKSGTSGTLCEYYLVSGVWNHSTVTSYDSTYYSDGTDRQSLLPSKWVAKYFFRFVGLNNHVCYIHGNQYTSASAALAESVPSVPLAIQSSSIYVGKIIIQTGATNGTAHSRDWGTSVVASATSDHASLGNLYWTDSGHIGTASVIAGFNSASVATYYTPSEIASTPHTQNASTITIPGGVGSPVFDDIQDWLNYTRSAGRISGGNISAYVSPPTADGKVSITELQGFVFTTNALGGSYTPFKFSAGTVDLTGLTDNTVYFIYFDWNGGSPRYAATSDRSTINQYNQFVLGRCWRSGNNVEIQDSGFNIWNRERRTQDWIINQFGNMNHISGAVISKHATPLRIESSNGSWYVGLNQYTTSAKDTVQVWYKSGSSTWKESSDLTLWSDVFDGGTSKIYECYQNGNSIGSLTANAYGVFWIYMCPEGDLYALLGTASYANIGLAQAASEPATKPAYLVNWGRLVGRVICKKTDSALFSVESIWSNSFTYSTSVDHASLTNLSAGSSGHTGFIYSDGAAGGQTLAGGTLTTQGLTLKANAADTTTGTITLQGLAVTTPPITTTAKVDAALSSEYITAQVDRDFSGACNWNTGSGTWSIVGNKWTHTAGANATYLPIVNMIAAPVIGQTYQIVITVVTSIAGTLTISYGAASVAVVGQTVGTLTAYTTELIILDNTEPLTITPNASWVGSVDDISVKLVTLSASALNVKSAANATGIEVVVPNATSFGIGVDALKGCIAANCTANGDNSLFHNTGESCSGFGYSALYKNSNINCTGGGLNALYENIGISSTALGTNCAFQNIGDYVTGIGNAALYQNTGAASVAVGGQALFKNTGANCSAIGAESLYENTGAANSALGFRAGYHATYHAQNYCTFLGYNTTVSADSLINSTAIGNGATITASNQIVLGDANINQVVIPGYDSNGFLKTSGSNGVVSVDTTSYQTAATNLGSIAILSNSAGWLHNDGSGIFAYSTPSKSDVGLSSVENTALSTWAGSSNLTTLGSAAAISMNLGLQIGGYRSSCMSSLEEDFYNIYTTVYVASATNSGTAVIITAGLVCGNHPGMAIVSGALNTANSGYKWYTSNTMILTGGEQIDAIFSNVQINDMRARIGVGNSIPTALSTAPNTGIYIDINNGLATGTAVFNGGTTYTTGSTYQMLGPAAFTASCSGSTMTVSAIASGVLAPGMIVSGTGWPMNAYIRSQISGSVGSTGDYEVLTMPGDVAPGTISSGSCTGEIFYHNRVKIADNLTSVNFYIFNDLGTQLWTDSLSSGLPTSAGPAIGVGVTFAWIQVSSGAITVLSHLDWLRFSQNRALRRGV